MSRDRESWTEYEVAVRAPVLTGLEERFGGGTRRQVATGALGGLRSRGVLLAAATISAAGLVIALEGYTPHPPVNPAAARFLISANDAIRAAGPYVLAAGLGLFALGVLLRGVCGQLDAALTITRRHSMAARTNLALTTVLVAAAAAASAFGDATASGANAPVNLLGDVAPAALGPRMFVVQQPYALPLDHSELAVGRVLGLVRAVRRDGGVAVPYSLLLGDVRRPQATDNPATSAIVLLPARVISRLFHISSRALGVTDGPRSSTLSVIANSQLGASVGQHVLVEDRLATVVKTIDVFPGLDRAVVIGPLEQAQGRITAGTTYSGLAVRGLSGSTLRGLLEQRRLPYAAVSFARLRGEYAAFWSKSVDPPEMQLVFYLWLASLAGLSFMKITDVLMRRQSIASLHADGARDGQLAGAEMLRAGCDCVKASCLACFPALGFMAMNASSQFGVAERFDLTALGAGFVVGLSANLAGALASAIYIRRMTKTAVERE